MTAILSVLARAVLSGGLALANAHAAPPAGDPLTTPARMSALAERALLLGVAQAGARIVAVGERGIIVYSDNGGVRWTQARVPVSVTLTAVHFINADDGFAVGHDGVVLASVDGGRSWTKQLDGNALNAMLLGQAQQGMARARSALAASDTPATRAAVAAAENALADAEAGNKFGPSRPLLGVWFKNPNEGYAVGAYGQAIRTGDAGLHWSWLAARIANPEGLHLNAIGAAPDGVLWIAGEGGKLYRSSDAGASWRTIDSGYKGQLYGVVGVGAKSLLAIGFGGHLLRSNDAGESWQALAAPTGKSLVGAARAPDGALLVLARDGSVLRSADQGRSFTQVAQAGGREVAALSVLTGPGAVRAALAGQGGVRVLALDK